MEIFVEHNPSPAKLDVVGVYDWPVWKKEISSFDWQYEQPETCYIIKGEATVTTAGGEIIELKRGDLVTFPAGLKCQWEIKKAIKKHYNIEG